MLFESVPAARVMEIPDQAPAWYAAQTKHQHEKKAAELLQKRGYEVFLPLLIEKHRWKDRDKLVSLPMFPCYLFLRMTLDQKMTVVQTSAILRIVGNAGQACPVSDSEIAAIRRVADAKVKVEPHPYLASGTSVRVRSGSLAGLTGVLVRVKNMERVVVSIQLLQKAVSVEVERSSLEQFSWTN